MSGLRPATPDGTAPRLRQAMREAFISAPKEPSRSPLPAAWLPRYLIIFLVTALTIGFTAGAIAEPINVFDPRVQPTVAWLVGVAQGLPLLFAPRWPLLSWRAASLGMLAGVLVVGTTTEHFWPWAVTAWLAYVVILFFAAVAHERQVTIGVGLASAAGVILPAVLFTPMPGWFGLILIGIIIFTLVFGDAVGGRYAAEHSLAVQAELRRQDLINQTKLEERARIAREIHDVVAHHMSVIAMQAEAAPYKIPDLPEPAKATFVVVRDAARDALAETRRVVGLLRAEDEGAEKRPQPGLDVLDDVVGGARQAGLAVEVSIVGVPRPVSTGVDLSAYRIVQESLSNAARYAPGGRVRVEVRYGTETLRLQVADDGPRTTPEESGGGHGLVGMRERATMLGGTVAAGPGEAGGWVVAAELPYGDAG